MKIRLFLSTVAAATAVPLLIGSHGFAATFSFYDVPSEAWYAPYVSQGVELGIATGYRDAYGNPTGYYGPSNNVTLAEALKMTMEAAGYDVSRGQGSGHWAIKYVSVAIAERINIYFDQVLYLDRPATRAEVASLVYDSFKVSQPRDTIIPENYTDVDLNAPSYHALAIDALTQSQVVFGDGRDCVKDVNNSCPKTTFRPLSAINRAEVVKIVLKAREKFGTPGKSNGSSASSASGGSCTIYDCGYPPAMPNWQCQDGSIGGPSCERLPDGRCGWLIKQCAISSSNSSSKSGSQSSVSSKSSSRSSSVSSVSSSKSSSVSSRVAQSFVITYSASGFSPGSLQIRQGDIVTFRSTTSAGMWVASNPHPNHTEYPELDMHAAVGSGGTFVFTFTKIGTWGYHNHFDPSKGGSVVVTH